MKKKKTLGIIVPCYNEALTIPYFYDELIKHIEIIKKYYEEDNVSKFTYEILFINDGSLDNTLEVAQLQRKKDRNISIYDLSRNFGKEAGLLCGLEHVNSEYVAIMDADLQDPPSLLFDMFKEIKENRYDVVGCRRVDRKGEPPIRSWFAHKFYKIINKVTDVEIVDGARDFRMMKDYVVDSIISLSEKNRFSKGLFPWVGFKTKYLTYKNVERVAGETSWNFLSLLKYAIDGIVAFTSAPLRVATILGSLITTLAFIFMFYIIGKAIIIGDPVKGYPSLITVITLFGGVQLMCIGILGEYMSKIYNETKNRPVYIVKNKY